MPERSAEAIDFEPYPLAELQRTAAPLRRLLSPEMQIVDLRCRWRSERYPLQRLLRRIAARLGS